MPRAIKPGGNTRYIKYSQENRDKAVAAVNSGKLFVRRASEKFGVPKSTISEHIKGKHPGKLGGQTALSDVEEKQLVEVLLLCAEWGQPLKSTDVRITVQAYLNRLGRKEIRFKENLPGRDWVLLFLKRNSELTSKLCENIKLPKNRNTKGSN